MPELRRRLHGGAITPESKLRQLGVEVGLRLLRERVELDEQLASRCGKFKSVMQGSFSALLDRANLGNGSGWNLGCGDVLGSDIGPGAGGFLDLVGDARQRAVNDISGDAFDERGRAIGKCNGVWDVKGQCTLRTLVAV